MLRFTWKNACAGGEAARTHELLPSVLHVVSVAATVRNVKTNRLR
eukprot:CAMPEP_0172842746 /NCGR_PEP_ID=MMETSP1075-20121228/30957_1 /TAXON_ID=2916 /ORGANISM="Ceratium fusus, Strain PA161109" /LENGTH=44 /DNA_ID= /DNA_START= /DNA_END= /DNA_ORIENTATION=